MNNIFEKAYISILNQSAIQEYVAYQQDGVQTAKNYFQKTLDNFKKKFPRNI